MKALRLYQLGLQDLDKGLAIRLAAGEASQWRDMQAKMKTNRDMVLVGGADPPQRSRLCGPDCLPSALYASLVPCN